MTGLRGCNPTIHVACIPYCTPWYSRRATEVLRYKSAVFMYTTSTGLKPPFNRRKVPWRELRQYKIRSPDYVREMATLNLFPSNNVIKYSSLLVRYALSTGANFDDLNLHMESWRYAETSVTIYQSKRRNIPEDNFSGIIMPAKRTTALPRQLQKFNAFHFLRDIKPKVVSQQLIMEVSLIYLMIKPKCTVSY